MRLFDFEEERVKQEIAKSKAKKVLIQLPEGLKVEGLRLAKIIEKVGALPIVSADPCYGACDLASAEAEGLGVDLIVHYGHTKLLSHHLVPTIYVEARAVGKVDNAVEKALLLLEKWTKIGLVTTVQHVQTLDNVKEILLRSGKTVVVGDAGSMTYPGQVVGCDYSNAKSISDAVDAFLFVGGGRFHAVGVALATSKPTVVAEPFEETAFSVEDEARRTLRQRWACIEEGRKAKTFAVVVGLKPGQTRLEQALETKKKIDSVGKAACLIAVRNVTPENLESFGAFDCYVNTACPRLSVDDSPSFCKPLLSVDELSVVIGELSWDDFMSKYIL